MRSFWEGAYQDNPFSKDLEDRLHSINNDLTTINKYVRDLKKNLANLQAINIKNEQLNLSQDIQNLESELDEVARFISQHNIQKRVYLGAISK